MKRTNKGFTLVELVIVVLILGILAAVAAPRLINTSANATDNGVKVTLGTIRDAIELYAAEHGSLPGQATGDFDGNGDPVFGDLPAALETYIRGPFPACPVGEATERSQVEIVTGDADLVGSASPTKGWKYNADTGEFIINSSSATRVDTNITYDQF